MIFLQGISLDFCSFSMLKSDNSIKECVNKA